MREHIVKQHDAGTNQPEKIRGWYDMVGGGTGFLLIETDNAQDVNEFPLTSVHTAISLVVAG